MSIKQYPTLVDKVYELEANLPNEIFLRQPLGDKWEEYSYTEVMTEARRLVAGMKAAGLQKGDKVGIYSKNCYQWIIAETAIMIGGYVTVPFYANLVGDPLKEVIGLSGIKMLFVGKLENWIDAKPSIPVALPVIRFAHYEGSALVDSGMAWEDFIKDQEPDQENFRPSLEDIWAIFFTSGTTGVPKGVVMPYAGPANIMMGQEAVHNNFNLSDPGKNKFFSYLPLNHIAEQALVVTGSIYNEGQISFAESLDSFAKNLADVQPSVFLGIPRIWTKFQQGVLAKMPEKKLNLLLKIPIISGLIKKKIKTALGLSDTKLVISGASALPAATSAWYQNLGIYIRETFGMTETMGVVLIQPKNDIRLGNAGKRLEEGQIKVDPETEEILVKNNWTFNAYYNEPELTKAAFTEDGFYKTGDTGTMDADGFVKVKGRVKDTFKTDKGEFIVPIPIEDKFAKNNLIELLCLVGLGLPQPIGLIKLSEFCADMDKNKIRQSLLETLQQVNSTLMRNEVIQKLVCIDEEWSVENGLLTPTMKIKRNEIHKRYNEQYKTWYEMEDTVIIL